MVSELSSLVCATIARWLSSLICVAIFASCLSLIFVNDCLVYVKVFYMSVVLKALGAPARSIDFPICRSDGQKTSSCLFLYADKLIKMHVIFLIMDFSRNVSHLLALHSRLKFEELAHKITQYA